MAKVYVSSTYDDLKDCRKAVEQELRRLGHLDVAMEHYAAETRSSLQRCLDDVAACDFYVGIFAWRYGWVPERDNPEGRSITELEYRKARAEDKPCLIFLLDPDAPWPVTQVETDRMPVLRALRNELNETHNPQLFRNCDDLRAAVVSAVTRYSREDPAAASGQIYSVKEKIRLLDGLIQINQRTDSRGWIPWALSVTGLVAGAGFYVFAQESGTGLSVALALGAFAIVVFLSLAMVSARYSSGVQIKAAKELNTLTFYRSLYEEYERNSASVDPQHLKSAERLVARYLKQEDGSS